MKKKSSFVTAILIAALLAGALLLLYPTVSDYWNSFHQSRAIASYAEQVADLDDNTYDQIWADARAYNETLDNSTSRLDRKSTRLNSSHSSQSRMPSSA